MLLWLGRELARIVTDRRLAPVVALRADPAKAADVALVKRVAAAVGVVGVADAAAASSAGLARIVGLVRRAKARLPVVLWPMASRLRLLPLTRVRVREEAEAIPMAVATVAVEIVRIPRSKRSCLRLLNRLSS